MKRLLILRHAKAEPAVGAQTDQERRLAARGRSDAAAVSAEMRRRGFGPDQVLCSASARTRETWDLAAGPMGAKSIPVAVLEELYLASPATIADVVRRIMQPGNSVGLVIGHNPGLAEFVLAATRGNGNEAERSRRAAVQAKFPTCALAVIDFAATSWSEVAPGGGTFVDLLTPRALSAR